MALAFTWIATALAFIIADVAWLSVAGPKLYKPLIGELLSGRVAAGAALAFYIIYASGLFYFAVTPAAASGELSKALLNGALLGMVAYATYDLTNQATLKVWSLRITLADLSWGAFASALAAAAGFLTAQSFI